MNALLNRRFGAALIGGCMLLMAGAVAAAEWPAKPIRLIVPFAAGGSGGETVARLVAEKLSQGLGQSVVLEYKPGAAGVIGSDAVARAEPDGYTIGLISDGHVITPSTQPSLPFDPVADFAPITQLVRFPLILVSGAQKGLSTTEDLIALAQKKPGQVTYGSGGPGSAHHLAMEIFAKRAGLDMIHVPYKGGAAAFSDVLGGHIDAMFMGLTASVQQIEAGKVSGMGVSSTNRQQSVPAVPTITEKALPGYEFYVWLGLLAPAGTPDEIVRRLNQEVVQAFDSQEVKDFLSGYAFEVSTSTPETFGDFIQSEIKKYSELTQSIGLAQ